MIPTPHGDITILHEDNHLLFIRKPVGLPVQADDSGDADLQNALKTYIKERDNKPGKVYLAIVHRLDRPVGGVMVLAKTSKAASRLSDQFRRNVVAKYYLAVLQKPPEKEAGTLRHHLIKKRKTNTVSVVSAKHEGAQLATLSYNIPARHDGRALAAIRLETGRPHQIRVQFAHIGCPLWGDHKYGGSAKGNPALFSAALWLTHPTTRQELYITDQPPDEHPWNEFTLPDIDIRDVNFEF